MKRSILATALLGALISPIVDAVDLDEMSVADYWSLAQEACEKYEVKEVRNAASARLC